MSQKNETALLLLSLVVTLVLVATGLWWFANRSGIKLGNLAQNRSSPSETTSTTPNRPVQERISAGEKLLIPAGATPEKQAAVSAIASGNYQEAVSKLEASVTLLHLPSGRCRLPKFFNLRTSFAVLVFFPATAVYSQVRVLPDLNSLKPFILRSLKILLAGGSSRIR